MEFKVNQTKPLKKFKTYLVNTDIDSIDYQKIEKYVGKWISPEYQAIDFYESDILVANDYKADEFVNDWNNKINERIEENTYYNDPLIQLVGKELRIVYDAYSTDSSFSLSLTINYNPFTGEKL